MLFRWVYPYNVSGWWLFALGGRIKEYLWLKRPYVLFILGHHVQSSQNDQDSRFYWERSSVEVPVCSCLHCCSKSMRKQHFGLASLPQTKPIEGDICSSKLRRIGSKRKRGNSVMLLRAGQRVLEWSFDPNALRNHAAARCWDRCFLPNALLACSFTTSFVRYMQVHSFGAC